MINKRPVLTLRQLGGRVSFVASKVRRRGGGEDPWLCGPGFRRVCLYRGVLERLWHGPGVVKGDTRGGAAVDQLAGAEPLREHVEHGDQQVLRDDGRP